MQEEAIIFTDAAANKVGALLQDEENNAMNLRVYVTGGGCAGFQYGFSFDEVITSVGGNLAIWKSSIILHS